MRATIVPWLGMVLAVGGVFAAAVWSARAEREAALDDFSHEQAVLARAIAVPFAERLARHLEETHATPDDETLLVDDVVLRLLGGAPALEHAGELMILVARPDREGFLTTDRRVIASARLRAAVDSGAPNVEVPRDDATLFGLPRRLAVAGVASVPSRRHRSWGVVVLASARRLRIREEHEQWRLALTVLVVGLVVGGFARMAQLRQRRELELSRQVAVSGVEREHDAALAKADKMATLAALSTGIAHELGTPLSVIVGRVEQVSERVARSGDERSGAALGIVLEQVERIQRIVRGSLALARGESPALERTDAALCLRRAADLVRHRFDSAGVSLHILPSGDVPRIASDAPLFEQALVNLLLNACQATAVGGAVRARVRAVDGESHVAFVVEDEGGGISDAHAARATEPFFSTKREQGGSGLGLTIVREIVSHHAGTFTLARREDAAGTRATIVLPAAGLRNYSGRSAERLPPRTNVAGILRVAPLVRRWPAPCTGPLMRFSFPRPTVLALIGAVVVVTLLVGTGLLVRAEADTNKLALVSDPKGVTVVEATAARFRASHRYVGTVHPWLSARIGPQLASGFVSSVAVRPGESVKRGAVLATLDCRNASAASAAVIQQAKALEQRQRASASEATRLGQLVGGGFASANEVEQKQAIAAANDAQLRAVLAQASGKSLEVGDCVLKAPFDGEIALRLVDPGAYVRPGTSIVDLVDRAVVRIEGDVPENDNDAIAVGSNVAIRLFATGQKLHAKVSRRAPGADPHTRTIHFEIDLPNGDRRLPIGTTAELLVSSGEEQEATEIPILAAKIRSGKATLFVVTDGVAKKLTVDVVGERGGSLFVARTLPPRSHVVTQGRSLLADGDRVVEKVDAPAAPASAPAAIPAQPGATP